MSRNIILISIDNLRYDCIGYQPCKEELKKYDVLKYLETPTLDRIASESVCFTQCISTNTYTTAAHASVLTGLYPPRHGVRSFYETKLSGDVFTLAEILKVYGYETVMMTDMPHLFRPLGLDRGFSHLIETGDEELINFFRDNRGKKIFAFIHFFDVHEPFLFSPHPAYQNMEYVESVKTLYENHNLHLDNDFPRDSKHCRSAWRKLLNHLGEKDFQTFFPLYVRGVTRFDTTRFNSFIKGLSDREVLDNALLLIFSDHGEGRTNSYDTGIFAHGGSLFDNVIRVPLLMYHKDFSHRIVDNVISVADIFTTIFNFALCNSADTRSIIPYQLDGIDLTSGESPADRAVYSETWQNDNRKPQIPLIFLSSFLAQRGLRTENAKYIINGRPEIFLDKNELDKMSDEKFIQNCYRGLLCRFERLTEHHNAQSLLKQQKNGRSSLINAIINSSEYVLAQPYLKYDLKNDPGEDRPASLARNTEDDNSKYLRQITMMSEQSVAAEEIFDDREITDRILDNATRLISKNMRETLSNKHILSCIIDDFIEEKKIEVYDRAGIESLVTDSELFSQFFITRFNQSGEKNKIMFYQDAERELNDIKNSIGWKIVSSIFRIIDTKLFPPATFRGRLWKNVWMRDWGRRTDHGFQRPVHRILQKKLLAITYEVPHFDRYSGASRFLNLIRILHSLNFDITLISKRSGSAEIYLAPFKELGIEIMYGIQGSRHLKKAGSYYDFVMLHTLSSADYIDDVKKYCSNSRIIFDTSDLHFLRLQRESEITGAFDSAKEAESSRQQEFSLFSKSDSIFVVSEKEKDILSRAGVTKRIDIVPNIHEINPTVTPFSRRKDMLFIGSFSHSPNHDAVRYFLAEIFPLVIERVDVNFYVIGSAPQGDILKYQGPNIIFTGYVPDTSSYFEQCRVMVAPLRYGAGIKGKLTQSMSMGLPFVTTSVGAEGMDLVDGQHCFIVDNPKSFSERTIELYENEKLWQSFRANSLKHAAERYSYEVVQNSIRRILSV